MTAAVLPLLQQRRDYYPMSLPQPLFNDKTHDHKWEIVPALNSGDKLKIQIARCASSVAKHEGLADNKGTLCFFAFMDLLEA